VLVLENPRNKSTQRFGKQRASHKELFLSQPSRTYKQKKYVVLLRLQSQRILISGCTHFEARRAYRVQPSACDAPQAEYSSSWVVMRAPNSRTLQPRYK
jgi:hypothetical protein